jgi:hypothetical protein
MDLQSVYESSLAGTMARFAEYSIIDQRLLGGVLQGALLASNTEGFNTAARTPTTLTTYASGAQPAT